MITKTGNVHLDPDEIYEEAQAGRMWMNVGFLPGSAVMSLTYGIDAESGSGDRKFAMNTYRAIMRMLTDGHLKLVHHGATVYLVRPGRG